MKTSVIILLGGSGKRMNQSVPKQFLEINDKMLLEYSIETFEKSPYIDEIILSVLEGYDDIFYGLKEKFSKITKIVLGGQERQNSVYNALLAIDDCDIVVVTDGARPFVTLEEIESTVKMAKEKGCAITARSVVDTIKIADSGIIVDTPDRKGLYSAKTPQAFKYPILIDAYKKAFNDGFIGTDDASLIERLGIDVYIVEANEKNIKITTDFDLFIFKSAVEGNYL